MTRRGGLVFVGLIVALLLGSGAVVAQFPTPTPEFWEVWQPGQLTLVAPGATYVNLRDWPSITIGKIIAQVRPGAVEVSNDQAVIGWQRIMVNGQKGWVSETAARVTVLVTIVPSATPTRTPTRLPLTATPAPSATFTLTATPNGVARALELLAQAEALEAQAAALRAQAVALLGGR